MPYLIDGNNLIFAMMEVGPEIGRLGLCRLLATLVQAGQKVRVVFDGPPPPAPTAQQLIDTGIQASFCPKAPADREIIELIREDSAPKLLTVVSSDREIRRAAAPRRCKSISSEDFARSLCKIPPVSDGPPLPGHGEPNEKRKGLRPEQTKRWLKEFGLGEH